MKYNPLKKAYHDSHLINYQFSQVNEITFFIDLDSFWNRKINQEMNIKFSTIQNISEVKKIYV